MLVNYGPVHAGTVLQRVDPDAVARTSVIANMRPLEDNQIQEFRQEVCRALGATDQPGQASALGLPTQLTLRWGTSPRDLDLQLRINAADDPQTTETLVSYQNFGATDRHPYCCLDQDITDGNGPEQLTITRWLSATYTIIVHNFSNESPLAGSTATVSLASGSEQREFQCPRDLEAREWIVCTIDGHTGTLLSDP